MTDTSQPPPPAPFVPPPGLLDAAGALAVDLPCRACDYNLRGLAPAGRCPECGRPIDQSLTPDLLRFADPAWLRRLARGARVLACGAAVLMFCTAVELLLMALRGHGAALRAALAQGMTVAAVLAALGICFGIWWLTGAAPADPTDRRRRLARWLPRLCVALAVVLQHGHIAALDTRVDDPLLIAALLAAAWTFLLHRLRHLMTRVPHRPLIRRTSQVRHLAALGTAALIALSGLVALANRVPRAADVALVALGPVGVLIVVVGVASIIVLFRAARTFSAQADLAAAPHVPESTA